MMTNRVSGWLSLSALVAGLVLASTSAQSVDSARKGALASQSEVSIPNTRRIEFISKVNSHRYSIRVALPVVPVPRKGYGVMYVLDGDLYFASATEAARLFTNAPDVIVVGIGYPEDPAYVRGVLARRGPVPSFLSTQPPAVSAQMLERVYDLTLPTTDETLAAQSLPGSPRQTSRNVGGLDDFLETIETEVKPRVAALARVDPSNQALFGHSLGGLAVLHALFVEPSAFRTFLIASPSIWWGNREVLSDEAKFAAAVTSGRAAPRVLVSMGSQESTPPQFPASWGIDPVALEAYYAKVRMVENGRELVARLQALHGAAGYVVEDYAVFDKEDHSVVPWSALARGIPFAFPLRVADQ